MGLDVGRAMRWGRRVLRRYMQAHTGKGDLGGWRLKLGRGDRLSRLCRSGAVETGDHLAFECEGTRGIVGWYWKRWLDLDDKSKWAYEYE